MSIIREQKYSSPYEVGRAAVIRSLIPSGNGNPALDLGCGSGFYSRTLSEKGWLVTAADLEEENVAAARRFAHEGMVGDAFTILDRLRAHDFCLALALELVEHISQGELLLRRLHEVLGNGGRLIISTPNRISPEGFWGYYWGEKFRHWGKWNAWDDTHVKIYSSFGFLRLLRRNGWTVERVVGYWYRGKLPLGIDWSLPFAFSARFPFNRFGFNVIVCCRRAYLGE